MRTRTLGLACVLTYLLTVGSYAQSSSVQSGNTTIAPAPRHIRVSGGVLAGNIVSKVQPVYPKEARIGRVSGTVVMKVVIGGTGTVDSVEAISGPEELRQAAVDAVQQWVYKPYLLNGNPVAVESTVTVNFNLTQD
jgi:protein TonB